MDYRSGGLICDLYLRPRDHRALWIGDDTYNTSRTDGLSRQQWRDNKESDRREHRECWNDTTGEIKIQDCKPRTRNIHRTFLNLLARSMNSVNGSLTRISTDCMRISNPPSIFPAVARQ